MFDQVIVAEDSERGLVLGVPGAPADPYAAVSLYLLDEVDGAGRAAAIRARLGDADIDAQVQHSRGVLALTASCPPERVGRLLAVLGDSFREDADAGPSDADRSPQEQLRAALFREPSTDSGAEPGPLVVAVTDGPTDELAAAVTLLDAWHGRGTDRTVRPPTLRDRPVAAARPKPSEMARLSLACPAPARDDPCFRAAALAAVDLAAVDGPVSTRLRHEGSAAYTVAARVHPERGCGWLSLETVVRRTARPDAAAVVVEELRRLADEPPGEERTAALRARMTTRVARALSDNRGRCSDVVSGVLYGLPLDHQLQIGPGIAAVTREDVATAARALDLTRLVVREVALP